MRTLNTAVLLSCFVLPVCVAAPAAQSQTPSDHAEDEAAIRAIVEQLEAGWNALDGAAFAAPFAEDADYVVINGMHIRGQQKIDEGHQQIFDTVYKDSHLELETERLRFLRSDVAIAHVAAHLKHSNSGKENRATITLVLTQNDSGIWRIDAFQNTRVQAPQGTE